MIPKDDGVQAPGVDELRFMLGDRAAGPRSALITGLQALGFLLRFGHLALRPGRSRLDAALAGFAPGRTLYYADTIQQRRALADVMRHDPAALLAFSRRAEGDLRIDRWLAKRLALRFAAALLRPSTRARYAAISAASGQALRAAGHFALWCHVLRALRPACVIIANDHVMTTRAVVAAARRCGVPSVYIQHACVSSAFPPLAVDYALLEGQHSYEIYAAKGLGPARVSLIGIPRLSGAGARGEDAGRIGLCVNERTPVDVMKETLERLIDRFGPDRVELRLHPRQYAEAAIRGQFRAFRLSDSVAEHPRDFLRRMSAIVAGNSSILLEAAVLGVLPVMYRPLDVHTDAAVKAAAAMDRSAVDQSDYYGFVGHGICSVAETPEQLLSCLGGGRGALPQLRARARYYCDTLGTPWDGRSDELAARCIAGIASGQPLPLHWDALS